MVLGLVGRDVGVPRWEEPYRAFYNDHQESLLSNGVSISLPVKWVKDGLSPKLVRMGLSQTSNMGEGENTFVNRLGHGLQVGV
jgi:hypothetical protein